MPGESPADTFAEAQAAVASGDWEGFFGCLERRSLLTMARNALALALEGGVEHMPEHPALEGAFHGADPWATRWLSRQQEILESAQNLMKTTSTEPAMMEESLRHRDLVQADEAETKAALEAVEDLPGLLSALERHTRRTLGGGSVSSEIFVGETLEEVTETGNRARGVRRTERGYEDRVDFVKRKGRWFIRLG